MGKEALQPLVQRLQLASYDEHPDALINQASSLLESRSRQRMGDRLGEEFMLLVLAAHATV